MVFYIDARGQDIAEYLAENCEYIGILGSKTEKNITPADISLQKINEHLANDEFLVALVMNHTWWLCLLFNNVDGATEMKMKHKGKITLWYWMSRDCLKFCMHNLQYKEFLKEFPEKQK